MDISPVSELRDKELDLRTLFIRGKELSNAKSELGDSGPVVTKADISPHCCFLPSGPVVTKADTTHSTQGS
ncbi:hypothetical protein C5167_040229 [Papaver somniferum]|uniref:Uncharacterized protein n=1 Tax=Papaver somniferum TaxID=3469 RepID=A0A4Y7IEE4_PAPSO|nr:hypothetical protein C5167_040229 [Papaver somniferum]